MNTKYSQIGKTVSHKFFIDIKSYPVGKTLAAKSQLMFAFKAVFNSTVYCKTYFSLSLMLM